jgi:hypothetical protein
MELNPLRVGCATALTFAVISLVCTAAVYLLPEAAVGFVNAWVHGLDLSLIMSDKPWTLSGVAYGLFGVTLTGFLGGALFAICYNLTGRCSRGCHE